MHRFKNILLVYAPNDQTLELAARLAQNNHGHLTVIHVIRLIPPWINHLVNKISSINLKDLLLKEYRTRLEEFAAPLGEKGLKVNTSDLPPLFVTLLKLVKEL